MNLITRYATLVKFSHTIFAMPFAVIAYFYALWSTATPFNGWLLVKVVLAMVFARNAAMGFNRWADREIDAQNPRTQDREIPAGTISAQWAMWFVVANVLLFMAVAWWINTLSLILAPVALLVLIGYSYTKRFTAWCHIILGVALGIAPIGAYIAVRGTPAIFPILLAGLVVTWVSGFDILYSLQDVEFDRRQKLHSIPVRWGVSGGVGISILLHFMSLGSLWILGKYYGGGTLYWVGASIFALLLIFQHTWVTPKKLERIGPLFGLINGLTSVCFSIFCLADLYQKFCT